MKLKELIVAAGLLGATSAYAAPVEFGWGIQEQLSAGKESKRPDFETSGLLLLKVPYGIKFFGKIGARLEQGLPDSGTPLFGAGVGMQGEIFGIPLGVELSKYNTDIQGYKTHPETGKEKITNKSKDLDIFKLYIPWQIHSSESSEVDIIASFMKLDGKYINKSIYGESTESNSDKYRAGLELRISW